MLIRNETKQSVRGAVCRRQLKQKCNRGKEKKAGNFLFVPRAVHRRSLERPAALHRRQPVELRRRRQRRAQLRGTCGAHKGGGDQVRVDTVQIKTPITFFLLIFSLEIR